MICKDEKKYPFTLNISVYYTLIIKVNRKKKHICTDKIKIKKK